MKSKVADNSLISIQPSRNVNRYIFGSNIFAKRFDNALLDPF